jgi:hypothetical protein
MHAQFFDKLALAADPIQITDQHNTQQQLRIDRWTAGIAVASLQLLTNEAKVDMRIDQPLQVVLWNLIFHGNSRTAIPSGCDDPSCASVLRQWQSTTAWSKYAAMQLPLPWKSHQILRSAPSFSTPTRQCTHYEGSPILEERLRHAQGCRGFAPAPPRIFRLVPLPMLDLLRADG